MRPTRLRRIEGFSYTGPHRYFLTICAHERQPLFEQRELAECVRTHLLRSASAAGYIVLSYCIMPDHIHVLAEGDVDSDSLPNYVKRFKQTSGYHGRRIVDAAIWQTGYFERVLRDSEDTRTLVAYILNNPIRRGLVRSCDEYPFSGSGVYSMTELLDFVQNAPAVSGVTSRPT